MAILDRVRKLLHKETTTEMNQYFQKQSAPLRKNPNLLGVDSTKTTLKGLVDFCASKIGGSLNERLHEALTKPGTDGVRAIFDPYREAFESIADHERDEKVAEQNLEIATKVHEAAIERHATAKNNYDAQASHYEERFEAAKARFDAAQKRKNEAQEKYETTKAKLDDELEQLEQNAAIAGGAIAR